MYIVNMLMMMMMTMMMVVVFVDTGTVGLWFLALHDVLLRNATLFSSVTWPNYNKLSTHFGVQRQSNFSH